MGSRFVLLFRLISQIEIPNSKMVRRNRSLSKQKINFRVKNSRQKNVIRRKLTFFMKKHSLLIHRLLIHLWLSQLILVGLVWVLRLVRIIHPWPLSRSSLLKQSSHFFNSLTCLVLSIGHIMQTQIGSNWDPR